MTANSPNSVSAAHARKRWQFIAVVAVFLVPILIALALNLAGYRPAGTNAYGSLIDPPHDVSMAPITLVDGSPLIWRNPQWQWTLLALPGATCAQACLSVLADVLRMRATLGRNAEKLRLIYLGPALPDAALKAFVPLQPGNDDANTFAPWRATVDDTLALVLVDPNGFLMMRYAPGFDVAGVRRDLPKVVK